MRITRQTRRWFVSVATALVSAAVTQAVAGLAGPFAGLVDPGTVESMVPTNPPASGAVSREFYRTGEAGARRTLSIEVGQGFETNYDTLRGSATTFRVGDAGEKRMVTLTVPSRLVRAHSDGRVRADRTPTILAMSIWKVRCVQSESYSPRLGNVRDAVEPTRWALTARSSDDLRPGILDAGSTDWLAALRNVVPGADHTAVVRGLFSFTAPGRYTCFATWGARAPAATAGDRVILAGPGRVAVSGPLADPQAAVQCFWRDLPGTGTRPQGCSGGRLTLDDSRVEVGAAPVKINRVQTSAPRRGANAPSVWMHAEATFRLTTCAGLQGGVSPCRESDIGTGGYRTQFLGKVDVLRGDGSTYPTACLQVAASTPTWRTRSVDTLVHHDELSLDVKFRILAGCSTDLRVVSSVRAVGGAAGWAEQDKSHLVVRSAEVGTGS